KLRPVDECRNDDGPSADSEQSGDDAADHADDDEQQPLWHGVNPRKKGASRPRWRREAGRLLFFVERGCWRQWIGRRRRGWLVCRLKRGWCWRRGFGAVGTALRLWTDVVTLDHLVQRRRFDVEKLGGALLNASCGFERRLDQAFLEIGDDVLERDP